MSGAAAHGASTPGDDPETQAVMAQVAELEASVNSMRALLLLVCRGRLMDKQVGEVAAAASGLSLSLSTRGCPEMVIK